MSSLNPGKKYRIRYKSPMQQLEREAVMVYLSSSDAEYTFSARPVAGTQIIPHGWFRWSEEVSEDTLPYLNRVVNRSGP